MRSEIHSASLAAVRTILSGSGPLSVCWEGSAQAGYLRASKHINIALVSVEQYTPQIVHLPSGSSYREVSVVDSKMTLQFRATDAYNHNGGVSLLNQLRAKLPLIPSQEIFGGGYMSPSKNNGRIIQFDAVDDTNRQISIAVLEQEFWLREQHEFVGALYDTIGEIHYTGSVDDDRYISGSVSDVAPMLSIYWDDHVIFFAGESQKDSDWFTSFPQAPQTVTLELLDSDVNVYLQGHSWDSVGYSLDASAPFSGSVRVRAIWSQDNPADISASGSVSHRKFLNPQLSWDSWHEELNGQQFVASLWNNTNAPIAVLEVGEFGATGSTGTVSTTDANTWLHHMLISSSN
jgi:hypothetical protein